MSKWLARVVVLACATVAGGLGSDALAQNREKAWEINPYVGQMSFGKVNGETAFKDTWDLGFRFGYNWTKNHEVEFGFFGASTSNGEGLDLNIDFLGGQVNYVYNFSLHRRDKIMGFGTAGVGLINVSSFGFVSDPELVGDTVVFSYNVGGGIRFFGGPRAGFRMDARYVKFSDQGVDVDYLEATVGLSIVLGGTY
jgi:hypothetical protein